MPDKPPRVRPAKMRFQTVLDTAQVVDGALKIRLTQYVGVQDLSGGVSCAITWRVTFAVTAMTEIKVGDVAWSEYEEFAEFRDRTPAGSVPDSVGAIHITNVDAKTQPVLNEGGETDCRVPAFPREQSAVVIPFARGAKVAAIGGADDINGEQGAFVGALADVLTAQEALLPFRAMAVKPAGPGRPDSGSTRATTPATDPKAEPRGGQVSIRGAGARSLGALLALPVALCGGAHAWAQSFNANGLTCSSSQFDLEQLGGDQFRSQRLPLRAPDAHRVPEGTAVRHTF